MAELTRANSNNEIEATIKTATELWRSYQNLVDLKGATGDVLRTKREWIAKSVPDKIGYFQVRGYSDFITNYPIVVRYMFMYNEYSPIVYRKYLLRLKTLGYGSKDDWVKRQADYAKMLWRHYHPHGNTADANKQWQTSYETLKDEMFSFENDSKVADEKAETLRLETLEYNKKLLLTRMQNDPKFFTKLVDLMPKPEVEARRASSTPAPSNTPQESDPENENTDNATIREVHDDCDVAEVAAKPTEPLAEDSWESLASTDDEADSTAKKVINEHKRKLRNQRRRQKQRERERERRRQEYLERPEVKAAASKPTVSILAEDPKKEEERTRRAIEKRNAAMELITKRYAHLKPKQDKPTYTQTRMPINSVEDELIPL